MCPLRTTLCCSVKCTHHKSFSIYIEYSFVLKEATYLFCAYKLPNNHKLSDVECHILCQAILCLNEPQIKITFLCQDMVPSVTLLSDTLHCSGYVIFLKYNMCSRHTKSSLW